MAKLSKFSDDEEVIIQNLYPELTPEQQREAEINLKSFAQIFRRSE
jgi:hypothetical protein